MPETGIEEWGREGKKHKNSMESFTAPPFRKTLTSHTRDSPPLGTKIKPISDVRQRPGTVGLSAPASPKKAMTAVAPIRTIAGR